MFRFIYYQSEVYTEHIHLCLQVYLTESLKCGLTLKHRRENVVIGRDLGVIYVEELIEILKINKIAERKWADREKMWTKYKISY